MTETRKHEFLWLDLETTGLLDASKGGLLDGGHILEVAVALVADDRGGDMSIIDSLDFALEIESTSNFSPWALDQHTRSGLVADCLASTVTLRDGESMLVDLCEQLAGPRPRGIVLAGNSVHFDLRWIQMQMPRFAACLSYRVFDVSTLIRGAQSWGTHAEDWARPEPAHRALDDIRLIVATAAKFRREIGL